MVPLCQLLKGSPFMRYFINPIVSPSCIVQQPIEPLGRLVPSMEGGSNSREADRASKSVHVSPSSSTRNTGTEEALPSLAAAARPTSSNGVQLSPPSKPILLFIANADHFGATLIESAGLELNAAEHPVETAQLSVVAEHSNSSAGGSRAQLMLPQSASRDDNGEHAHQQSAANDEDILALMPDNCDPSPAPAMLSPIAAAEAEVGSSKGGVSPNCVQQDADSGCSHDSLSLGTMLARLLSGTTSSSSQGTSRKGSNSGNHSELREGSDDGSKAVPSALAAAGTESRLATLSAAAASELTTQQMPGSDTFCDSYCTPTRLSLNLGLDLACRSSLLTALSGHHNHPTSAYSRCGSGPAKPAAWEGVPAEQQQLGGGKAAEEATQGTVQVVEVESAVPRAGEQPATKASGRPEEKGGRRGYTNNQQIYAPSSTVAAALLGTSGMQVVRALGLARTGSSLKAPVSSSSYATIQSPCAPDTSCTAVVPPSSRVLAAAPQPSALPASAVLLPLAPAVGGGQESKGQPSAESSVGDTWASPSKTATPRRSAMGTPRTQPSYIKPTLSSATRVASSYCCDAASPGFRSPASRTASSRRVSSVSPRLTKQPAHHEAALEEYRSQRDAKARAASPTPLPKATVVQEFQLRTSRRAEGDAARVAEEALLTTEEREAREAEAARQQLLETIRASWECASRAATPRPAAASSHKVAEPTVPAPFKLASEALHERAQQELVRLVEAKLAAEQPLPFKASVFEEKIKAGVAAHKSPKGQFSMDFKVPAMTTDARIERYHTRERQRWARADEMARAKAEKEQAKQEELDREAEEYRQQHRICISPVPDFSHVFKPDLSKKRPPTAFCPFKLAHTAGLA